VSFNPLAARHTTKEIDWGYNYRVLPFEFGGNQMNKHWELRFGPIVLGTLCLFAIAGIALRFAVANVAASAADAGATYSAKCVKCHGRDGRGKTTQGRRTHARDITDANWQNDVTDERLFNSISNGRGKMPAFKKSLNENQIDELISYLRRLRR